MLMKLDCALKTSWKMIFFMHHLPQGVVRHVKQNKPETPSRCCLAESMLTNYATCENSHEHSFCRLTGREETHTESTEEVFDGVFSDVVGEVAQEGGVGGAAGQTGAVDVGLTGGTWSCWQNGPIDGRRTIHVIFCVPGCSNCKRSEARLRIVHSKI